MRNVVLLVIMAELLPCLLLGRMSFMLLLFYYALDGLGFVHCKMIKAHTKVLTHLLILSYL